MLTKRIKEQFLIENKYNFLVLVRFDNFILRNCQSLSTAYKFQSVLFIQYVLQRNAKQSSYLVYCRHIDSRMF